MNQFVQAVAQHEHTQERWIEGWSASQEHTVAGALGIELVSVDDDGIVLRMEITSASRQPFGLLHGGVSMVLAESAASCHATWKLDVSKTVPVGIEINGSHLRSATSGFVRAEAKVVRRGAQLVVHEIELRHEESGKLLNVSRVTNLYIPSPAAGGS